jgi:nitrilase
MATGSGRSLEPSDDSYSRFGVLSSGGSCVIGPLGEVLAGPARDGEETLFADLDLDEITRGKFDLDVAGHYARPDVFRLLVDEEPKLPVAPCRAGSTPKGE